MTTFLNNDGSILITTPIIINIATILQLKRHQQFPYLLSGALVATASSAPIAVSNLANLIALKIVNLDLNSYVSMMFVPSMAGIITICLLLFYYFRKDIPKKIMVISASDFNGTSSASTISIPSHSLVENTHPSPPRRHAHHHTPHPHPRHVLADNSPEIDRSMFKVCIVIVVLVRVGLFVGTGSNISIEWIGIFGALMLIGYRWYSIGMGPYDIVKKTPWHIFAFSIYVVVYGLHNIGLTGFIHVAYCLLDKRYRFIDYSDGNTSIPYLDVFAKEKQN